MTPDISDSFLNIQSYEIARSDSPSLTRKHGVAVYVHNDLKFEIVDCYVDNVLVIYLCDYDLYVVNVYRPPSNSLQDNEILIDFLLCFCSGKEIILQGDFNLPSLNWKLEDVLSEYVTPLDNTFFEAFISAGLEQIVKESTFFPSGTILDLFFTTDSDRIGNCKTLTPLPRCSHVPVFCSYVYQNFHNVIHSNSDLPIRLWSKGNYTQMGFILSEVDWEFELYDLSPTLQYAKFKNILFPMIDRFIPYANCKSKRNPPWVVNPPRHLERECSTKWHNYKQLRKNFNRHHPDVLDAWRDFRICNDRVKNFAISSQIDYERSLGSQLSSNPKLFHSYVKHRKTNRPTIGPIKQPNGILTDDPQTMADCFAISFASVFNNHVPINCFIHQQSQAIIDEIIITVDMVARAISTLNPNSAVGYDGIHPRLLRALSDYLSLPLSIIFNSSLHSGILPVDWLHSIVVPIFKKSHRYETLNYRPVSLTSVPCKVMEKLIVSHINAYLHANNLLTAEQYGFRSGHSTTDNLLTTYNIISQMLDQGKVIDLVFFDFSKAFDSVVHSILLDKLFSIGVCGILLEWIRRFLSNRSMRVKVAGALSKSISVISGVPQGSVLGPLLFIIYVNFVVSDINCYYKVFADDVKLYLVLDRENLVQMSPVFQQDIDTLVNTSASWGLNMNGNKCVAMRFCPSSSDIQVSGVSPYKIGQEYIAFVQSHSDLGITVDRALKFHSHIIKKVAMLNGLTNNFLTCTLCRDSEFLMNLYISHIRPHLEYGSSLWNLGYLGDSRLIERVQRRWTREVAGLSDLPYGERLRRLDLFSVQGRLLRADLILVWKILNGYCAINPSDIFSFSVAGVTRGHPLKLFLPRSRLEVRHRFFSIRVINIWNSLSHDTVMAETINSFKSCLKGDLGDTLFQFA